MGNTRRVEEGGAGAGSGGSGCSGRKFPCLSRILQMRDLYEREFMPMIGREPFSSFRSARHFPAPPASHTRVTDLTRPIRPSRRPRSNARAD